MKNREEKKQVAIYGGGWSGLTAALEASKDPNCEVHVHEASERFGGKVSGEVSTPGEPSTHAIRMISEYYPKFFETLSQIPIKSEEGKTLMDRLSKIEDFYFRSEAKGGKIDRITRKTDEKAKGAWQLYNAAVGTYNVGHLDLAKIALALHNFNTLDEKGLEALEDVKMKDYLADYSLSKEAKDFILNFEGITVAARPGSSARMGMDLLSKMFLGVARSEHIENEIFEGAKNWIVDGPMEERLIPPFIEELEKRGVHLHLNSPLKEIVPDKKDPSQGAAIMADGTEIKADVHITALNNKVAHQVGIGRKDENGTKIPLENEWSSGAIVPLKELPAPFDDINLRSALATIDSPWAVVGMVMAHQKDGGLWSDDVKFPEDTHSFLEIVVSEFNEPGLNGRTFFECTPEEAKREMLMQLGIKDEKKLEELVPQLRLGDNIGYSDATDQRTSAEHAKTNPDGNHWVLHAPIYTANPSSKPLPIQTEFENVLRCGEAVGFEGQEIRTPTLELATEAALKAVKMTFDQLNGLVQEENNDQSPVEGQTSELNTATTWDAVKTTFTRLAGMTNAANNEQSPAEDQTLSAISNETAATTLEAARLGEMVSPRNKGKDEPSKTAAEATRTSQRISTRSTRSQQLG